MTHESTNRHTAEVPVERTKGSVGIKAGPSQVGGGWALPVFGQTDNPISTRGADYAYHSTTGPPGFSDLATALTGRMY